MNPHDFGDVVTPKRDKLTILQWVLGIATVAFLGVFTASEWDGVVALFDFLGGAVESSPDFLQGIVDYYELLPTSQLIPSLVMGVLFGIGWTVPVVMQHRGGWSLPFWGTANLLFGVFLLLYVFSSAVPVVSLSPLAEWVDANITISLIMMVCAAFILAWFLLPTDKRSMQLPISSNSYRFLALSIGLGAFGGAFGSQAFMYPIQHCTFGADIDPIQYRLGIGLAVVGVLIGVLPLWTVLGQKRRQSGTAGFFRSRLMPYALLTPTLIILIVFLYYPALQIVTLSLKLRRNPLPQERFVCLDNYVSLSGDTIYQNSFLTTTMITIALVLITMGAALGIAVLASQKVRGATIYRTLLIWPFALSPVVSGVIFLTMFREGGAGVVNFILSGAFGIEPSWLRDPDLAPWVIIMASVWNGLGFNILFYIAGLQNVPQDLLEAAAIDGATALRRFWNITFPLLSPFTFFLLVTNVTYAFYGIYGVVDAITRGGPPIGPGGAEGGATNVLIFKLYEDAFGAGGSAGLAAAQALILFLLVAAITVIQFRYVENRVTYSS